MYRWVGRTLLACWLAAGIGCATEGDAVATEPGTAEAVTAEDGSERPRRTRSAGGSVAANLQDASIEAQIKLNLVEEDRLRLFDIEPVVEGGRVVLQGEVQSAEQRALAGEIAGRVSGVRGVVNELSAPDAPPEPTVTEVAPPTAETPPPPATEEATPEPEAEAPVAEATPPAEEKPAETPAPKPVEPAETYHTVKSGESLWTISRQYNTSISRIKQLNNLRSDNLRPGQRLRVR